MNIFSIFDNIRTSLSHVRLSYRQTVITSIGLIISLAIVSSTTIFLETQSSLVLGTIIGENNANVEVDYNIFNANIPFNTTKFTGIVNTSLTNNGLMDKVSTFRSYFISHTFIRLYENITRQILVDDFLKVVQLPNLSLLQPYMTGYNFNTFNYSSSTNVPAIFMYFNGTGTLRHSTPNIGQTIQAGYVVATTINSTLVKNVTIIGNIAFNLAQFNQLIASGLFFPHDIGSVSHDYLIVQNISNFMLYLNSSLVSNNIASISSDVARLTDTGYYYSMQYGFNTVLFDGFNPFALVQQFNTVDASLDTQFIANYYLAFSVINNFNTQLKLSELKLYSLFAAIIAFAIPIILITLYIADFTLNLYQRQNLAQIRILLARGIGKTQLLLNYVLDMILTLIIGIFGGFIISVPLINLTINTSGLLEFNTPRQINWSVFTLFEGLIITGIILLIISNFFKVKKFLSLNLASIDSELIKERKEPFWKRKYLDIFLLGIGLFFNSLSLFSIFNFSASSSYILSFQYLNTGISSLSLSYQILSLIFLPTPIYIFIGAIMFTARIYPIITAFLSTLTWNYGKNLIAYSLKNMHRHRYTAIRVVILTALTMSLIIAFFVFPVSYATNIRDSTYYTVGSDIYVPILDSQKSNYTFIENTYSQAIGFLNNLSSQIQSYTPIISASLRGNPILAINTSTFAQTAWMRQDFVPDLNSELQKLHEYNNSILLYSNNLHTLNLNAGDNFIWPTYQGTSQTPTTNVNVNYLFGVQGTFNYWPRLIIPPETNIGSHFYGVISWSTYKNIDQIARSVYNISYLYKIGALTGFSYDLYGALGLYIHTYPTTNLTLLTTLLETYFGSQISVQSSLYHQLLISDPFYTILVSQINTDIIFCLIILFILVFVFGFYQINERGREVAIERSFGMTLWQNFRLMAYELGWTIVFGIVTGVIIGIALSGLLLIPTQSSVQIPPVIIIYPALLIAGFFISLMILALICSLIPAYISTKVDIKDLLKVE